MLSLNAFDYALRDPIQNADSTGRVAASIQASYCFGVLLVACAHLTLDKTGDVYVDSTAGFGTGGFSITPLALGDTTGKGFVGCFGLCVGVFEGGAYVPFGFGRGGSLNRSGIWVGLTYERGVGSYWSRPCNDCSQSTNGQIQRDVVREGVKSERKILPSCLGGLPIVRDSRHLRSSDRNTRSGFVIDGSPLRTRCVSCNSLFTVERPFQA